MRRSAIIATVLCAQAALGAETMRIAMGSEVKVARLSGENLSFGDDLEDSRFQLLGRRQVTVERRGQQLLIDSVPIVGDSLRVRAGGDDRDGGLLSDEPISVNGTRVRGDVVAVLGKDGLQLVNVIALEDYLVGVLGSEMPTSFPLEALKAQSVAARTYALQKKLEQYGQPFHLGSGVISQVYGGLQAENPRTRQAVQETAGLVLTYELQPIEAYFHSSCGGRTETGFQALGRDLPYLKAVSCPCGKLPQSEWTLKIEGKELQTLSGGKVPAGLQVAGRTPTGRATRVQVGARNLDAVSFRERVGYQRVKSLQFDVEKGVGSQVVLHGHGFGHGAGLCQWGAKVLAEQGRNFREILTHYYPGTELQTLY